MWRARVMVYQHRHWKILAGKRKQQCQGLSAAPTWLCSQHVRRDHLSQHLLMHWVQLSPLFFRDSHKHQYPHKTSVWWARLPRWTLRQQVVCLWEMTSNNSDSKKNGPIGWGLHLWENWNELIVRLEWPSRGPIWAEETHLPPAGMLFSTLCCKATVQLCLNLARLQTKA